MILKVVSALGLLTLSLLIVIAGVLVSAQGSDGVSQRAATITPRFPLNAPFSPESTAEPIPVDREKYSPARYGIPDKLAGFEVVAVISHETNPCSPEDFLNVMLQATEPTLEEYLRGDTPQGVEAAMKELQAIYPKGGISISGPIEDMDALFVRLEENYLSGLRAIANGGCVPLGGPFQPLITPPPVDREKYSPARYGIPETLEGFEVVAVITHEHNPCAPADFVMVMLYPLEGLSDRDLNDALSAASAELKTIHPGAVISMAVPPDPREEFFAHLDKTSLAAQTNAASGRCGPSGVSGDRPVLFATATPRLPLPESSAEPSQPIQVIVTPTPFR